MIYFIIMLKVMILINLNVYDDYSLKDVFKDYIYNLEDENNHETKGIKYYVYDKTDEKIFFTNSKKNLKKAFETQDKKVLNDYQWYATIDYDENGNVSLEGNQTSDWEGSFYNTSFDQLFKNNYLDEGNSDIINQITINNPTNIKVLIAIPKKLPTNCYLEELCSKQGSISDVLITYVFIIVAALVIFMLFVPVRKLIEIEPFKTVVKVKLFFMFFILYYFNCNVACCHDRSIKGLLARNFCLDAKRKRNGWCRCCD